MVLFLQFPNPPLLPSLAPVPSDCSDGSGGGKSEQHEALDDALMKRMRNYWLVLAVLFAIALWVGPVAATTFTALDLPGYAHGISGNNIVGYYSDQTGVHGYLYDGSTLTTLDDPSETFGGPRNGTWLWGISGSNILGSYWDSSGGLHYFEATVPEPSTFALLGAAAVALIGFRWRKKRA